MTRIRTAAPTRITSGWILASGLTLVAWALAAAAGGRHHVGSSTAEALAVLAIAAVKARIITQEFMEVRRAPRGLRLAVDGWFLVFWAAAVIALQW